MTTGTAAQQRQIRVWTANGTVEGVLNSSAVLRLQDDLNVVRAFLTIHDPQARAGDWPQHGGPLAIRRSSILFVEELSEPPERPGSPTAAFEEYHFTRAPVELRVHDYSLQGVVHVPAGGTAMARLQQDGHDFLAVTAATVRGPDTVFEAGFVAVNRNHILAARGEDVQGKKLQAIG